MRNNYRYFYPAEKSEKYLSLNRDSSIIITVILKSIDTFTNIFII